VGAGSGFDRFPNFEPHPTDLSGLDSAQAFDADFDGWPDVIGSSATGDGAIVLGANRPRGMLARPEWLGGLIDDRSKPLGVFAADFTGEGWPQLLVLHDGRSPALLRTDGNGNRWLALHLAGRREKTTEFDRKFPRSNRDGIGTRVVVRCGPSSTAWDNTTLSTGLCQSLMPLSVGLLDRTGADAVHLRWPSGVEQAELSVPAGQLFTIEETRRRGTSCPLLFVWNGRRFEFVTDFLGGGGIGYLVAPGVYAQPDPDEDVKLEPQQIAPDHRGRFVLRIAEPMDEMTYLDAVWLEVIDHPNELSVYPDERFDPETPHPSGGRFAFRDRIRPEAARDPLGRDALDRLRDWDRRTIDGFRRSARWTGYAEEHSVELDFGRSFAGLGADEPIALFLAGWVEYPYSQTNWAAATAGVQLQPPVLEWQDRDGQWQPLITNFGYPAGLPRMMTVELTGKLPFELREPAPDGSAPLPCRLRIRTNMEIYWDEVFAARLVALDSLGRTVLKPVEARLCYRGYLQEFSPDGQEPQLFDYHQIISVPLVSLDGQRTPYGDVRQLVLDQDERFVLINAGDEVTLAFDGAALPTLPSAWTRSFVLRSFGYCKDTDLFNPVGGSVEPLPGREGTKAGPRKERRLAVD
jgi:hypothetical protein